MKKCEAIAFFIVALIFMAEFVPASFAVDAVEATDAIGQAEASLNSAFVALAEAQDVGANVSKLLEKLKIAGDFLSEAHAALRSCDYEVASLLAVESGKAVDGVVAESAQLKEFAETKKTETLFFNAFWSGFGLILLAVLGIVVWVVLKQRYIEHVFETRPEVEEAR